LPIINRATDPHVKQGDEPMQAYWVAKSKINDPVSYKK